MTATLLAWETGEGISILVNFALPVNNLEVIFLEELKPSSQLTLWFTKVAEPGKRSMVSTKCEFVAKEVGVKMFDEGHHS